MQQLCARRSRSVGVLVPGALVACVLGSLALAEVAAAASLRGSRGSMDRQTRMARAHDYTFLRNPSHVRRFVDQGWLTRVSRGRDYELVDVSFPYTRPEVLLFIERLSRQYRSACGEKLVVTSLTRPRSHQPANASRRSVHPTGMALDLRRSRKRSCRAWLERVLLSLERNKVLEATYESRPPHYHVAVFPKPYQRYVERITDRPQQRAAARSYRVTRGDTLWKIAARHDTSVRAIKSSNGLRSNTIRPGQLLTIP